jgi:hypothetical protein
VSFLRHCKYSIRKACPAEFSLLGELTVDVYASLPEMPSVVEQPGYYGLLRDVCNEGAQFGE